MRYTKPDQKINFSTGLTLIELLIGVLIGSILIIAVYVFLGRGIVVNREQFEQVLTTEDARLQLDKISDRVREAQGANWLITAEDNSIKFYSDVDENGNLEEVTVFLDGSEIKASAKRPNGSGELVITMARSVRNIDESRSMFTYYDRLNAVIPAAQANSGNVKRIGIALLIDVTPNQAPGVAVVETIVSPRATLSGAAALVRLWPVTIDFPTNPFSAVQAIVTTTNNSGGAATSSPINIVDLNRNLLSTYDGGYYTNINYQSATIGSFPAGWYAWIGPIVLNESGGNVIQKIDQVPISNLCTGNDLDTLLANCPERTVSSGGYSKTYKPVLTYVSDGGALDYVKNITFNYLGGSATPTPSVTPTPTPSPTVTPTPTGTPTPTPVPTPNALAGPNSPNSSNISSDSSTGSNPWTNPANVADSNNAYATAVLDDEEVSHYLKATNFGFNIPANATIFGIEVQAEVKRGTGDVVGWQNANLVKNGVIGSTNRSDGSSVDITEAYKTFGSNSDLWGETFTPADVNSTNFGAALGFVGLDSSNSTISVDHIRITVHYLVP